jgi:NTE family protein
MSNQKKIALVIGWGSVKCAAALGLLRVLSREGIKVDMMVTSGGGSIFGALFALGYDVEEIVEMNQRLWTHEVTEQTNRLAILQILFPRLFRVRDYFNLRNDEGSILLTIQRFLSSSLQQIIRRVNKSFSQKEVSLRQFEQRLLYP